MRTGFTLATVVAATFVAGLAGAQDPNHVLTFSSGSTGPPGGTAVISNLLDMPSAPNPIAGWSWGVCQDSALVDIIAVEDGATTITLDPAFVAPAILPGEGWTVGVVIDFFGMVFLNAGSNHELHITTYSLFAEGLAVVNYCDTLGMPLVETVLVDDMGGTIIPTQLPGEILIGPDGEPLALKAGTGTVAPGAMITVAVTLDNENDEVEGFGFGITHDGTLVTLNSIDPGAVVAASNGGAGPDFFAPNVTPGGGDGGTVGCAISLEPPFDTIPVGLDNEIVLLSYTASGAAPDGSSTSLDFTETLGSPPVIIVLAIDGFPVTPLTESGTIDISGMMVTTFRRSDANNDSVVDISDVVFLAKALFGVGDPITCDDAGDTDDNGELEPLIDTFFLLLFLFQDGPAIPAPFPGCGGDPTDDALECDTYGGACP